MQNPQEFSYKWTVLKSRKHIPSLIRPGPVKFNLTAAKYLGKLRTWSPALVPLTFSFLSSVNIPPLTASITSVNQNNNQ